MRLSLRARQVATVTALVVCSMATLAAVHLSSLARLRLEESGSRGELLARAIFHRARVVVPSAQDPELALREDSGIRAILESSIAYTESVTYAVIVDPTGIAIAHSSPSLEGTRQAAGVPLSVLLEAGTLGQLRGVYRDATLEIREPLLLGETPFGSIRVGLSTVLIRHELERALRPAVIALIVTLGAALIVSLVLAQWTLKPIHVIKAGLNQLERGEPDIRLELPPGKDFADVGQSFDAISARLAVPNSPAGSAPIESVIEQLEDAVAILDADGAVLFTNSAMKSTLPDGVSARCLVDDSLPPTHPYRQIVGEAVDQQRTIGPVTARIPAGSLEAAQTDHEITAHGFESQDGRFGGIMLVARNIGYLSSVQSTVESSRQVASLGRLLAGVAHEVKNPLNAMTIHLELLRQKLAPPPKPIGAAPFPTGSVLGIGRDTGHHETNTRPSAATTVAELEDGNAGLTPDVLQHLTIIGDEIRRLDDVIQGFLRFIRPEDLARQTVLLPELIDEVFALVRPEASHRDVRLENRSHGSVPTVIGDPTMLRQALLNLALNACQAMPSGGQLRVSVSGTARQVVVDIEDNGTGMSPDVLERIFELYYTTKSDGSGIGLSMVYRIVQLHGGEIEVESTPDVGTRFRVTLPRAWLDRDGPGLET